MGELSFGRIAIVNRGEAAVRLINGLERTMVAVESGATNASFLLHLLDRPEGGEAAADTGWLNRLVAERAHLPDRDGEVAVLVAAAGPTGSDRSPRAGTT